MEQFKSVDEILNMKPQDAFIYAYKNYASNREFRKHVDSHPRKNDFLTLLKSGKDTKEVQTFRKGRSEAMAKTRKTIVKKQEKAIKANARAFAWKKFKFKWKMRTFVTIKLMQIYYLHYKHKIKEFFVKSKDENSL